MYGKNVILFADINKTIIVLRNLTYTAESIAMKLFLQFSCFQICIILKDGLSYPVLNYNA